jgi:hypothetical protein
MLWSQFSAIFDNFRRKNWRFSQKPMLWSKFLHNLALFWVKNANFFAEFFVENIYKIITSVPGQFFTYQKTLLPALYICTYIVVNWLLGFSVFSVNYGRNGSIKSIPGQPRAQLRLQEQRSLPHHGGQPAEVPKVPLRPLQDVRHVPRGRPVRGREEGARKAWPEAGS